MNNYKEEKVAEGIYITKFNTSQGTPKTIQTTDQPKPHAKERKYLYKNTAELISMLENEFEEMAREVEMLYKANEDMLEFDPKDYDLIQAREENLVIINRRLNQMKEIQNELRIYCPNNPILSMDLFSLFLHKGTKAEEDKEKGVDVIAEIDL